MYQVGAIAVVRVHISGVERRFLIKWVAGPGDGKRLSITAV